MTGFTLTCRGSDGVEGGEGTSADVTMNQDTEPGAAEPADDEADTTEAKPRAFRK